MFYYSLKIVSCIILYLGTVIILVPSHKKTIKFKFSIIQYRLQEHHLLKMSKLVISIS